MKFLGAARFFLVVLLFLAASPSRVGARRGEPGSPAFGYGAQIEIGDRAALGTTLETVDALRLDWIRVELAWDAYYPKENARPNWSALDQVMEFVASHNSAVLLSLTRTPAWAMTSTGPNPDSTARLAEALAQRYPKGLGAIELFPGANTQAGWGAIPDPTAYTKIYNTVYNRLVGTHAPIVLVAGGLKVTRSVDPSAGKIILDTDFLRGMYASEGSQNYRVISLQYDGLDGNPITAGCSGCKPVLRHYEEVRKIMTGTGHTNGLIWITQLNLTTGLSPEKQSSWLAQAYPQIRSQLYIGAAFLQSINQPAQAVAQAGRVYLIRNDGSYHPFFEKLKSLIDRNVVSWLENSDRRSADGSPGRNLTV